MPSAAEQCRQEAVRKVFSEIELKRTNQLNNFLHGGIAQLGERLLCKQEVNGSIPFISTTDRRPFRCAQNGLETVSTVPAQQREVQISAIVAEETPDSLEAGTIWAYSSAG